MIKLSDFKPTSERGSVNPSMLGARERQYSPSPQSSLACAHTSHACILRKEAGHGEAREKQDLNSGPSTQICTSSFCKTGTEEDSLL